MTEAQLLQDVKSSLQRSKHNIDAAIKGATTQLNSLYAHRNHALHAQKAAENRYSKLKELTESLCDQCWEIFPALDGKKFTRGVTGQCINCGLLSNYVVTEKFGLVQNPPQRTDALDQAESACNDATQLLGQGQRGHGMNLSIPIHSTIRNNLLGHRSSIEGRIGPLSLHYHSGQSSVASPFHNMKESKRVVLDVAQIQKNEAEKQLETTLDCIKNWTSHINQHKLQLQKINSALADVEKKEQEVSEEEKERAVLEQRLRQLNGGRSSSSHSTPDNSCPICWNRAKEIVFQCGHQCCSACSSQIHVCHLCRVRIVQSIKLH
mmetsp:Transcript_35668/g.72950  ORF Transcript_35668/g.72950 Transcript_35668/m.72950 type:complete len:321 (-) Transcript_35668:1152-2114(-)